MLSIFKHFFQIVIVRSKLCQFLRKIVFDFYTDLISTLANNGNSFINITCISTKKQEAQGMIFALQDKLVLKELYSARLYYNLGNYLGNNYESCVITAQNALKDYPYTDYREELSILVLRARHEMAIYSVEDKKMDRYRETIDEYYAFKNEFPESKYLKEAEKIFNESQKVIKD